MSIIKRVRYSSLAQSVEHAAVNRRVVGSSPTGGAKKRTDFQYAFLNNTYIDLSENDELITGDLYECLRSKI